MSLKEPRDRILRRKASKQNLPCQVDVRQPTGPCVQPPSNTGTTPRNSKRKDRLGQDASTERKSDEASNSDIAFLTSKEPSLASYIDTIDRFHEMFGLESVHGSGQNFVEHQSKYIDLNGCRHVDVKGLHDFSVHDTRRHQPIARDWATSRKRFTAAIACINTALVGIVIGIYAGEVPAIQHVIVDLSHHTILGNFPPYLGLAIPTFILWPLPMMHGSKPYTVMALVVALCLQIPKGITVSDFAHPTCLLIGGCSSCQGRLLGLPWVL